MTDSHVYSLKLRRFGIYLLWSSIILVLDQASKLFMIALLASPPSIIPVTPFFNLTLGFNRGVSFGLLNDLGTWGPIVLSSLAVVIVGFLLVWLWNAGDNTLFLVPAGRSPERGLIIWVPCVRPSVCPSVRPCVRASGVVSRTCLNRICSNLPQ